MGPNPRGDSKLVGIMEICAIVMEIIGEHGESIAGLRQVCGGRAGAVHGAESRWVPALWLVPEQEQ